MVMYMLNVYGLLILKRTICNINVSFYIGIGFKSVFLISSQPHIFSNGYQIKFNEKPCPECNIGYIVPE